MVQHSRSAEDGMRPSRGRVRPLPRCEATPSTLEPPRAAASGYSSTQAADRLASVAFAAARSPAAAAAAGGFLRGPPGLRGISLGPDGVLTSALVANAAGTNGQQAAPVDDGYRPINRVAYQVGCAGLSGSVVWCRCKGECAAHYTLAVCGGASRGCSK